MKGDPEFVILKQVAWVNAAGFENEILGAIVKEPLSPITAHQPPNPLQYNAHGLVESSFKDVDLGISGSHENAGGAKLKSIARFYFKDNKDERINLSGKLIRCKRIQQLDQYWNRLKDNEDVKSKVPEWISWSETWRNTWPPCLVVGIMICEDAEHSSNGPQSTERKGSIELPVNQAASAAGVPMPSGSTGNPGANLTTNQQTETTFKAQTHEGQIFALELRKVTKKFLRQATLRVEA